MVDQPTTRNRFRKQETGTNTNTWGTYLNQVLDCVDQVTDGYESIALTGDYTLVTTNYTTADEAKNRVLNFTGAFSSTAAVTAPSVEHQYTVRNSGTAAAITFKTAAGTGVTIPSLRQCDVYSDSSDYYVGSANWISNFATTPLNAGDIMVKSTTDAAIAAAIAAASTNINGAFVAVFVYTATAGQTSFSGVDDNGQPLAYTAGYNTLVLRNGALQVSVSDYVATTGTSITGLSSFTAGEVLTVVAFASFSVANTLTQTQVDALIQAYFAAPPALGFGSTTARPVAATTGNFTGTVTLADATTWASTGIANAAAYSTASTAFINFSPTYTYTSTGSVQPIQFRPTMIPAGASSSAPQTFSIIPTLNSGVTTTTLQNIASNLVLTNGSLGTVSEARLYAAGSPSTTGAKPITALEGFFVAGFSNGNALATGTVTNYGVFVSAFTAASASGGTVNNNGVSIAMPTGVAAGTSDNVGLSITGNGQTGTAANYAIRSTSTALSLFAGTVSAAGLISSGAVVAGSASVTAIDSVGLLALKPYTVATVPTASPAGRMIYVSDGTSNKRLAVSDATNWRFPDGNIVS